MVESIEICMIQERKHEMDNKQMDGIYVVDYETYELRGERGPNSPGVRSTARVGGGSKTGDGSSIGFAREVTADQRLVQDCS